MAKTEHRRIVKKRLYVAQECRCFYCDKPIHIEDASGGAILTAMVADFESSDFQTYRKGIDDAQI